MVKLYFHSIFWLELNVFDLYTFCDLFLVNLIVIFLLICVSFIPNCKNMSLCEIICDYLLGRT